MASVALVPTALTGHAARHGARATAGAAALASAGSPPVRATGSRRFRTGRLMDATDTPFCRRRARQALATWLMGQSWLARAGGTVETVEVVSATTVADLLATGGPQFLLLVVAV